MNLWPQRFVMLTLADVVVVVSRPAIHGSDVQDTSIQSAWNVVLPCSLLNIFRFRCTVVLLSMNTSSFHGTCLACLLGENRSCLLHPHAFDLRA